MRALIRAVFVTAVLFFGLPIAACGDSNGSDGRPDGGTADAGAQMCDPMTDPPAQGTLLNAPLGADVEVIQKSPRHPGAPGPKNLP